MNRRWVINDVLMDIFPFFDHAQLGLKLALISPRFDALVDTHFNGKKELTLWRTMAVCTNTVAAVPHLWVAIDEVNSVTFPLPDHPLHNKIRFNFIQIEHIDHSVVTFLRSNQQIWDKGINLDLLIPTHTAECQQIWDVFVREIWPFFATNIRRLSFSDADYLDTLRRCTSPTILTDLNQLNSIYAGYLLPDVIDASADGPNATFSAGQALSKWLHTPSKNGQLKRLFCKNCYKEEKFNWVNNFKEAFIRATATSTASYKIQFSVHRPRKSRVPFELVNDQTQEKLTMKKASEDKLEKRWIMKRCQIGETSATIQWEEENLDDFNSVFIWLVSAKRCIGPLSPTPPAEEAGQNNEKVFSTTPGPSGSAAE